MGPLIYASFISSRSMTEKKHALVWLTQIYSFEKLREIPNLLNFTKYIHTRLVIEELLNCI